MRYNRLNPDRRRLPDLGCTRVYVSDLYIAVPRAKRRNSLLDRLQILVGFVHANIQLIDAASKNSIIEMVVVLGDRMAINEEVSGKLTKLVVAIPKIGTEFIRAIFWVDDPSDTKSGS